MGAYISRCWNPPRKGGTSSSGAPTPENGALAATSTQSAEETSATTTQGVVPVSPGAASAEAAAPHAPASEDVQPGSSTTPRVDRQMSIPISIDESDDGIPKGGADGNMSSGPKPIPPPEVPPPPKPKPGGIKQRFRLPFGGTDEE